MADLPLWKIWVRRWEGWHTIYEMDNNIHVWNHQPVIKSVINSCPLLKWQSVWSIATEVSEPQTPGGFVSWFPPSDFTQRRPSHQGSGFQHIAQSPSFFSIHFWHLLQICSLQQALQPDTVRWRALVPARNVSNDDKTNGFWKALFYPRIFQHLEDFFENGRRGCEHIVPSTWLGSIWINLQWTGTSRW